MPYTPKTWTDRVVEKPMTYTVTNNPDGSITLTPAEGTVITVGDLVKAEYLNAMEQGIKSAHDDIALKAPLASPALTGTPTVPTAAVDTSTTQAASTAFVTNQASASNPVMDGTVAIGTSKRYARADHVHPIDTSRAPLASPTFTGTPTLSGAGRLIADSPSTGTDVYYVWSGTQAQYDAIGSKDANTLYFIVG